MAPGGGAPTKVPATGHLKYDEYGNLTIDGRVTAAAGGVDRERAEHVGPRGHRPRQAHAALPGRGGDNGGPDRPLDSRIDAAKVSYYEFVGDQLKTTTKDASGATTAIATWKRAS